MEQLKNFARRANLEREECLERERASARERGSEPRDERGGGSGGGDDLAAWNKFRRKVTTVNVDVEPREPESPESPESASAVISCTTHCSHPFSKMLILLDWIYHASRYQALSLEWVVLLWYATISAGVVHS